MTTEQVEEQKRGETAGISQENVHAATVPAAAVVSAPKIAIKFKTKKVKSAASTLASQKCDNPQQQRETVSKAKQQQIANIGKWNEKKAELKDENHATTTARPQSQLSGPPPPQVPKNVRTTVKGEPICMLCKKKFPNLSKLRLHETGSELHKKNLKLLQEKRKAKLSAAGAKRKLDDPNTKETPMYTDRAEKRRQLHGTDLCAPVTQSMPALSQVSSPIPTSKPTTSGADLLDKNNMGHKMLLKMGYRAEDQQQGKPNSANGHLRKEWDRIEAMAQKSGPRNR